MPQALGLIGPVTWIALRMQTAHERGASLPSGVFGENLTTAGLDVTRARIGERWRIGDRLLLQVTGPRIPCATFATRMHDQGWVRAFTRRARPGAYLPVLEPAPSEQATRWGWTDPTTASRSAWSSGR